MTVYYAHFVDSTFRTLCGLVAPRSGFSFFFLGPVYRLNIFVFFFFVFFLFFFFGSVHHYYHLDEEIEYISWFVYFSYLLASYIPIHVHCYFTNTTLFVFNVKVGCIRGDDGIIVIYI